MYSLSIRRTIIPIYSIGFLRILSMCSSVCSLSFSLSRSPSTLLFWLMSSAVSSLQYVINYCGFSRPHVHCGSAICTARSSPIQSIFCTCRNLPKCLARVKRPKRMTSPCNALQCERYFAITAVFVVRSLCSGLDLDYGYVKKFS